MRSILEVSGALARQPSVLARQLEQLATDLCRLVSADAAFGCMIEDGLSDPDCQVHIGSESIDAERMFHWLAQLSTSQPSGTQTFRGEQLAPFINAAGVRDMDAPPRVSNHPGRTAVCFRREPKRVICLALLRGSNKRRFSASDLATLDLMVGWGWVPAEHRRSPGTGTPRQRELLDLLKSGHSEKEAAQKLQISFHTVHVHVKKIYQRFGVSSRQELLSLWIR
jgi:DNA-binding CsgD family transcriptional regulator